AGMTGTADTEAFEFKQIYKLEVVVIPTHLPMIRDDRNDLIYMTEDEKYDAIVQDINECTAASQPVLVGTTSIDSSERLSKELKRRKIQHSVLNAKQHEREAEIVAQAGRPGNVTIATNMAGRGTDIVLGGNFNAEIAALGDDPEPEKVSAIMESWDKRHKEVIDAGGLHIVGTERHESRRIDNQLRGRSGRQGDPGSSRFYLSMEDNLMRLFASERWNNMIQSLGIQHGEAIEAKMVNNAIERAQRRVEGRNFDIRKNLLEFDDVSNDQRLMIYKNRNEFLDQGSVSETVEGMRSQVIDEVTSLYIPPNSVPEEWDVGGFERVLASDFGMQLPIAQWMEDGTVKDGESVRDKVFNELMSSYQTKRESWASLGLDADAIEKRLMLSILDQKWKDHLQAMEQLRQGIHLRGYAQKQPKQEYKRESFFLFEEMLANINHETVRMLSRVEVQQNLDRRAEELRRQQEALQRLRYQHEGSASDGGREPPAARTFKREQPKVGRNAPCPCGSGKKYKQCCGRAA
ncbi:MAG: preprotein translocase subunit SecA, partial [Gammaproteobacteria bacterium]|nr:preprotein translocase subunit SecA [Gammaproteobacteria bacterium]